MRTGVVLAVCVAVAAATKVEDPNKVLMKRDHPAPEAPSAGYGAPPAGDSYGSYSGGDQGMYYYYYPTEEAKYDEKDDKCAVEKILPTLILIDIFLGIIAGSLLGLIPAINIGNIINALPIPNLVLPKVEDLKPNARHMEEMTSFVTSAIESEDCLPRLICETGKYAEGYTTVVSMMEFVTPKHFQNKMKVFKDSALKKANCKNYKCYYADWTSE